MFSFSLTHDPMEGKVAKATPTLNSNDSFSQPNFSEWSLWRSSQEKKVPHFYYFMKTQMGYLLLCNIQGYFGVIQCICLKGACISKTTGCREQNWLKFGNQGYPYYTHWVPLTLQYCYRPWPYSPQYVSNDASGKPHCVNHKSRVFCVRVRFENLAPVLTIHWGFWGALTYVLGMCCK